MNEKLICTCGGDLIIDQYDNDFEFDLNANAFSSTCYGQCVICNKKYRWNELYDYIGFKDLEEYEE